MNDPPSRPAIAGKTVRDPVCGTYVAEELAIPGPREGTPVYFCSEECRRRYKDNAERPMMNDGSKKVAGK